MTDDLLFIPISCSISLFTCLISVILFIHCDLFTIHSICSFSPVHDLHTRYLTLFTFDEKWNYDQYSCPVIRRWCYCWHSMINYLPMHWYIVDYTTITFWHSIHPTRPMHFYHSLFIYLPFDTLLFYVLWWPPYLLSFIPFYWPTFDTYRFTFVVLTYSVVTIHHSFRFAILPTIVDSSIPAVHYIRRYTFGLPITWLSVTFTAGSTFLMMTYYRPMTYRYSVHWYSSPL